jgi:NADPH:quinone reductase
MRALVCRRYGTPEDLELAELPDPAPGPGEVLVEVSAAAANFADALVIGDAYQVSLELPFVPGSELAGEVLAVGAEVTGLKAGDLVFGTAFHGAFAERAVLPAGQVTKMPDGADFGEAAAFGVAYRTAYHALRSVAEVTAGDWVVVLGAAGGVGLAAVDIARELGARVVAAASGQEKLELCRQRGATHVIDYTTEDLKTRIRDLTEGGAHAVIDPVGGAASEQALRSLRPGGTFVTLGYASGTIPKIPLNLVLLKDITVKGMEIRTFGQHHPELEQRDSEELLALFAAGRLRPHIGARFPLAEAAAALRHVADRRALGKVVIDIRLPPPRWQPGSSNALLNQREPSSGATNDLALRTLLSRNCPGVYPVNVAEEKRSASKRQPGQSGHGVDKGESPQPAAGGIFDGGLATYRTVTEDDYHALLTSGLVVLDTNALLNLYRYVAKTREDLIAVLTSLEGRLWIPHHVMLEFLRAACR